MIADTAKEIVRLACKSNRTIEAIKLLRLESNLGLSSAKDYVVEGIASGEVAFYARLCDEFVLSKADLLVQARAELRRVELYIQQLEQEIADEEAFIAKKLQD
jgi:hypothetical protein